MIVYTEDEVVKLIQALAKQTPEFSCKPIPYQMKGIEVSIMAFQHSGEKIVLEVSEKHINEIITHDSPVIPEFKFDHTIK